MKWGVFETEDDDTLHVVPIDIGEDETTHILSDHCFCCPAYDQERAAQGTKPLLIHEIVQ